MDPGVYGLSLLKILAVWLASQPVTSDDLFSFASPVIVIHKNNSIKKDEWLVMIIIIIITIHH